LLDIAGRAGRLGPGFAYRLWSEAETRGLAAAAPPEIEAADLAGLVLELALWGVREPDGLAFLTPPPEGRFAAARALLEDALALEAAGCFAIVLEAVPSPVAAAITARLHIPTIGIGAGVGCDGQVLVLYDALGLNVGFRPKFLKRFGNLDEDVRTALGAYVREVRDGSYPGPEHSFSRES